MLATWTGPRQILGRPHHSEIGIVGVITSRGGSEALRPKAFLKRGTERACASSDAGAGCARARLIKTKSHYRREGFELMGVNFRNGYEFDPETYGGSGVGGLPGLLRQVMLQQGAPSQANPALAQDPSGYDNPRGLFGRLLALQAEQPEMLGDNEGRRPSPLPNSAIRQLSARVATPPPVAIRPTSRSEEQSYLPYPRFGEGALPGASPTLSQGGGSLETSGAPSAPIRIAGASTNMLPFGWGARGASTTAPTGSGGAGAIPQIPMPHIPDWWKFAWELLHRIPTLMSEAGSEAGEDENQCIKRWYGEYDRCDMFGRRDTSRWRDACRARANDLLKLCYRNRLKPDSE